MGKIRFMGNGLFPAIIFEVILGKTIGREKHQPGLD